MKLKNIIKMIPILGMAIIVASSCDKAKTYEPLGGAGSTFVKITGGGTPAGFELKAIDFVSTPSIIGVDVQRMVANSTELTKTMTVVVKLDTAAVTAYNAANGKNYTKLPNSWFTGTPNNPKVGGEDGTFTMTFKSGEFGKNLEILVPNATLMDPSTTYALGLTIISVDADGKISDMKSKVIGIGAKNAYDGVYSLDIFQSGWAAYGIEDGTTNTYPVDINLVTTGANTDKLFNTGRGDYLLPGFSTPLAATGFGAVTPVFSFDPSTNLVTVTNSTPDDGRGRFIFMDPAYTSSYNPTTRRIFAAFYLTQIGRPNMYMRFTFTYLRAR